MQSSELDARLQFSDPSRHLAAPTPYDGSPVRRKSALNQPVELQAAQTLTVCTLT